MMRWNLVAGSGLALIAISAFFFMRIIASPPESTTLQPATSETSERSVSAGAHTFLITNQESGTRFFINAIETDRASWVVVYSDDSSEPLGAFFFPQYDGIQSGGGVLQHPLVSGEHYRALLHEDDGDNSFRIEQDPPLSDRAGLPIQAEFFVQ